MRLPFSEYSMQKDNASLYPKLWISIPEAKYFSRRLIRMQCERVNANLTYLMLLLLMCINVCVLIHFTYTHGILGNQLIHEPW